MARRRVAAFVSVFSCAALFVGGLAGVAVGKGHDGLPLPGYGAAVVDAAHRQVFVSGGSGGQGIAVAELSHRERAGNRHRLIENQPGAHGMVLSEDGRTLFVALSAADAVSAIDTATHKETARYAVAGGKEHVCPTHLARTGTLLWIGYGCEAWEGGIARLDTAAGKPELELDQHGSAVRFERAPALTATGTVLVASQPHLSPARLLAYTVGTDKTLTLAKDERRGGSNLNDLALTPDGTRLLTAAGSEDRVLGFTTPALGDNGAWYTRHSPVAVAPSPDGTLVAVGVGSGGHKGKEVSVYPLNGSEPKWAAGLPSHERLLDRGLVWLPDQSALVAVTVRDDDPAPRLRFLKPGHDGGPEWPIPVS
ncbi:40-residue YVTN family beta-propeller repeat-containing protein [Streptomyces sp. DI166]|nr:40-residue YVTN family beta-propeller repeat-containing protein [Streptomyces sp. DI166]